ncbi:hypothetical protein AAAC51_09690 [Priestia megaterium]
MVNVVESEGERMIYYMLLFIFMLLLTIVNIQAMPKLKDTSRIPKHLSLSFLF